MPQKRQKIEIRQREKMWKCEELFGATVNISVIMKYFKRTENGLSKYRTRQSDFLLGGWNQLV